MESGKTGTKKKSRRTSDSLKTDGRLRGAITITSTATSAGKATCAGTYDPASTQRERGNVISNFVVYSGLY